MTLIADGFPKLQAAKDVLRQMSKKPCFRIPFDSRHVKGSQRLGKLTKKMALLEMCELLGMFVCTLTANDKCSLRTSEN